MMTQAIRHPAMELSARCQLCSCRLSEFELQRALTICDDCRVNRPEAQRSSPTPAAPAAPLDVSRPPFLVFVSPSDRPRHLPEARQPLARPAHPALNNRELLRQLRPPLARLGYLMIAVRADRTPRFARSA